MGLIAAMLHRLFPPNIETIADARTGRRVVIRGRVVARDLIDSPLTEARCVYYRYLVEERRNETPVIPGSSGLWMVIDQDEAIAPFIVEDDTGRALVVPEDARIELGRGVAPGNVPVGERRRASETRIDDGSVVEVEGLAEEHEDLLEDGRGYRERPTRLALRAPEGDVIRIRLVTS